MVGMGVVWCIAVVCVDWLEFCAGVLFVRVAAEMECR